MHIYCFPRIQSWIFFPITPTLSLQFSFMLVFYPFQHLGDARMLAGCPWTPGPSTHFSIQLSHPSRWVGSSNTWKPFFLSVFPLLLIPHHVLLVPSPQYPATPSSLCLSSHQETHHHCFPQTLGLLTNLSLCVYFCPNASLSSHSVIF